MPPSIGNTVALLRIHLIYERDLIMAEVYRRLWYILIIIPTLQYVVNLREQRQFFVSVVSGHIMPGALTGLSSNWSAQKIVEAVIQNLMVLLAVVLGGFSPSNGNRRDNCKTRLRL